MLQFCATVIIGFIVFLKFISIFYTALESDSFDGYLLSFLYSNTARIRLTPAEEDCSF